MVECDAEQITQVLLNLILNALQILGDQGQIRLATHQTAQQFFIEISDNGPGIPVDERGRIFEAFFFRREGGVGLGLAIVQQIIVAHGGDIEVGESDMGGARFTIRLPHTMYKMQIESGGRK
jgi:two-component system sensor histidine kinase HydH